MGWFNSLYLIEGEATSDTEVLLTTSIHGKEMGESAYFSWIEGHREAEMQAKYGSDTLFCSTDLPLLPGYPVKTNCSLNDKTLHDPPSLLFEANFTPPPTSPSWNTVVHVVMPPRYVPRRHLKPLVQPEPPFTKLVNDRFILTWAVEGSFSIRFCASPLDSRMQMHELDLSCTLAPPGSKAKLGGEIGIPGMLKLTCKEA